MKKEKVCCVNEITNLDGSIFDTPRYQWLLEVFCIGTMDVTVENTIDGTKQHILIEGITLIEIQPFSLRDWPDKNLELVKLHMKERGLGLCVFFNKFGIELGSMATEDYQNYNCEFGFDFKHVEYMVLNDPDGPNRQLLVLERSV